ncbi:hypothetical protein RSAG8_08843, partial [Rhizoctonia solani AG-8 WAC10335]
MAPIFSAKHALLNPKFDGYKLKIFEQQACVQSFPIRTRISPSRELTN